MLARLLWFVAVLSLALTPAADAQFRSRAAPGRTVGLRYFVTAGVVLGPELIINGDFTGSSGWIPKGGASISGGQAHLAGDGSTASNVQRLSVSVTSGAVYRVSVVYSTLSDPGSTISGPSGDLTLPAGSGTLTTDVTATSSSFTPQISDLGTVGVTGDYDNYSVRKVN